MGQLEQTLRDLVQWGDRVQIGNTDRPWREARQLVHRLDFLDRVQSRPDHEEVIEIPPEALHGFPWTAEEVAQDFAESRQWTATEILEREG